jgi:hypothetical protein
VFAKDKKINHSAEKEVVNGMIIGFLNSVFQNKSTYHVCVATRCLVLFFPPEFPS